MLLSSFISFFFQAEDGIRYHCVTGVQTCALPISSELAMRNDDAHRELARQLQRRIMTRKYRAIVVRSEERRVGKEWKSWWWTDDKKKDKSSWKEGGHNYKLKVFGLNS